MNRSFISNATVAAFYKVVIGGKCWGMLLLSLALLSPTMLLAEADQLIEFDISRQRADAALTAFAQQADITVIFRHDVAKQHQANEVNGSYLLTQAAEKLLDGSGLRAVFDEQAHLTIVEITGQEAEMRKNKTPWITASLASLASIFSLSTHAQSPNTDKTTNRDNINTIEEILVTATKRALNLQDIPASITALGEIEIDRRGLVGMDDYLSTIPGVNMSERGVSSNKITIRGVNASIEEDSTVGVFFGEVPLNTVSRGSTADMKMVDVNRVEVLRGPQGTLFGSGSMGGAIRNIPNAPNTEQVEGKVEVGYSDTARAGGGNYKMLGVVNVPIIKDTLAIRMVGYNYDYSGYVDNIGASDTESKALADFYGATVVDKYGVGGAEYTGARASVLWTPTEKLSFNLMYATQDLDQDGQTEVNLSKGGYTNIPWQIGNINGGDEQKTSDLSLTNLVIEYDLEWASLLSSTSWLDHDTLEAEDLSKDFGIPMAQTREHYKEGFVQEVRLASQWDSPFQMIAGVYYEDLSQNIVSEVPWTGNPDMITETPYGDFLGSDPDDIFHQNDNFTLEQKAIFGEATYAINEQWTALIGARWFDYNRRKIENQSGVFAGGVFYEDQTIKEKDTSWKANVSYTPNEDTLIYAQWAQGFRVGRPITPAPSFCDSVDANGNPGSDGFLDGTNVPITSDSVESDFLDSYELGGKFTLLDNRLQVNAAAYYIDWSGIPVSVFAEPHCGFAVVINAGKATITGGELETMYYLNDSFRFEVGLAYTDAELAEGHESLGPKGTRLPGSSKYKGNLAMQYEYKMFDKPSFARFNYTYVGGYYDYIDANTSEAGDYSKLDLRAGVHFDTIDFEIYATNLLNDDAITHVLIDPVIAFQLRPRTIGFDIRYRF